MANPKMWLFLESETTGLRFPSDKVKHHLGRDP